MNFKHILIAGACFFSIACQEQSTGTKESQADAEVLGEFNFPDSLSASRISYVLDLKQEIGEKSWLDFGTKQNEGTLVYFHKDRSEIFFPSQQVLKAVQHVNKYSNDYCLTSRTDSLPYHMEVMISFNEEDSSRFYHHNPVEQYSSVEEINQYIPSVRSTEMWATMVIHEMFHHYQYNNPNYADYASTEIAVLPFSSIDLVQLCREDKDFMKLIQKENNDLLLALEENEVSARDSIISAYLSSRKERIASYSEEYPDLEAVENYYIIQEGSARYIEYQTMLLLSDYAQQAGSPAVANDSMFLSYSEFNVVDLDHPDFSYLTYAAPSDYHYAIGFGTMRLLDKLNVDYKEQLLNSPQKGLHTYLEDYLVESSGGQ